jgi:pheromone a factor receptor
LLDLKALKSKGSLLSSTFSRWCVSTYRRYLVYHIFDVSQSTTSLTARGLSASGHGIAAIGLPVLLPRIWTYRPHMTLCRLELYRLHSFPHSQVFPSCSACLLWSLIWSHETWPLRCSSSGSSWTISSTSSTPLIWPTGELEGRWNGAGLCDVEVKLNLASSAAIPGALICIFRQLALILDTDNTTLAPSRGQRRRSLVFEVLGCILCPLYMVVVHFTVQPYRYYIFAMSGCVPCIDSSWPGIILIFIPPLLLCAIAAGYCALVVVRLLKYRQQFSTILALSPSKLNKTRFLRLFILSTTSIVIFLPIAVYVFTRNLGHWKSPFSWSRVHSEDWPKLIVRVKTQGSVNFDRWITVGIGYAAFLFFGFGSDATKMYGAWLLGLGLGRFFPKLSRAQMAVSNRAGSSARTSNATKIGSMSSRARFIFHRKQSARTIATM